MIFFKKKFLKIFWKFLENFWNCFLKVFSNFFFQIFFKFLKFFFESFLKIILKIFVWKFLKICENFFENFCLKIFENLWRFFGNLSKKNSTILTKNKLQRIAKNKLQIVKFVKNHSSNSSNKSLTFLLVCRNLPGKANFKISCKNIR